MPPLPLDFIAFPVLTLARRAFTALAAHVQPARLRTPDPVPATQIKVVVATTVMLSFITFWRAAAIVLNDLASSAFYAGGVAEESIGKAAPWFILGVMLFGFAIRALSTSKAASMFVRGGVYRSGPGSDGRNHGEALGSPLLFDYVLTGPISGVSAGLYLAGLLDDARRLAAPPRARFPACAPSRSASRSFTHFISGSEHHRPSQIQRKSPADHTRLPR